jgi:AcrR family transcriptional regulator
MVSGKLSQRGGTVNQETAEVSPLEADKAMGRYADRLRDELERGAFASKGDRTRQRLRIAAAEVLETEGFQGMKVSDVCERAEVAQGTFYVYFHDKVEIAVDVLIGFIDDLYELAKLVSRGKDDFSTIRASNLFFIRVYSANRGLMQCHVQMESQEPAFRAEWEPRHKLWRERLARSIERRTRGRISGTTALSVATALEGMVFNFLYTTVVRDDALAGDDGSGAEQMADALSLLWYRAVFAADPPHLLSGDAGHVGGSGRS